MQQYWCIIYIAVVIMAANGHVQDLRVDVIPVQTKFAAVQNVNVVLKYSNIGGDTMAIYKWYVPEKELGDPVFKVTRNGEPVEYVGPLFKRRAPTADDLILLAPGMSVSTTIQLSSVYNMTQTGNYVIQYKMDAGQVLITTDGVRNQKLMASNDDEESVLQSAPVMVFAVGRRNRLIEQAIEVNMQTRALAASYIQCTAAQTNTIKRAITAAENYGSDAVQYFNGQPGTVRYTTWFGTYVAANWQKAKTHFTKIQNALNTQAMSFDCSCPGTNKDAFAYVYPTQHYRIYLCNAFWPASTTGTDTQGGTIIHELAHFTILAGTQDHAYGQASAQSLAKSNPAKALMNSDNLEYFVENSPRLN
jgi:peptidyl-Lys metalloendopeptidase